MKIYTKTGDKGMTTLIGGERVFKTDLRVEAYGTVDELSAFTALLADNLRADTAEGRSLTESATETATALLKRSAGPASAMRERIPVAPTTEPAPAPISFVADLNRILSCLMTVEALLARGEGDTAKVAPLAPEAITWLETRIDAIRQTLCPIDKFTLPGGHTAVSLCHVCRTVCRRAERAAWRADQQYGTDAVALTWLNRLSDYFYVLSRALTEHYCVEEVLWKS